MYILRLNVNSFHRTYGPPKRVQSDRGGEFQGATKAFLEKVGIEHIRSRAYHPQSQGKCERSHGTWKRKIQFDLSRNINNSKFIQF